MKKKFKVVILLMVFVVLALSALITTTIVRDYMLSRQIVGVWEARSDDPILREIRMTFEKDHTLETEFIAAVAGTSFPTPLSGHWKIQGGKLKRQMSSHWNSQEVDSSIIQLTPDKLILEHESVIQEFHRKADKSAQPEH